MEKKKKRGHSWLKAMKSWAFRSSPVKESHLFKTPEETHHHHQPDQKPGEELEKRETRRWLFRKPSNNNVDSIGTGKGGGVIDGGETKYEASNYHHHHHKSPAADQRHAIAVAAAAAEAAVATAQAAVEIIRLTRSTDKHKGGGGGNVDTVNDADAAATIIQTAFRGYLARRALVALRGIVKLQALIRGQNMRKQAEKTLKYMHALLRVQARVREQQARLSHDGNGGRKSMSQLGDYHRNLAGERETIHVRKSMSNSHERSYSGITDEWSRCPPTLLEDLESSLQAAAWKEALDHEARSTASEQVWRNYESTNEDEEEERRSWVDKYWMSAATKQQHRDSFSIARSSIHKASSPDTIKTLQVDTPKQQQQYQYSPASSSSATRKNQSPYRNQSPIQKQASPSSPRQQRYLNSMLQQPLTPSSPSRNNKPPLTVRSSSPRRVKEEKSFSTANSPCGIRSFSNQHRLKFNTIPEFRDSSNEAAAAAASGFGGGGLPNYMAATESAKARLRSQSAPRQRPSTPERERVVGYLAAKKRLSYPVPLPEPYCLNNNGDQYNSYSANLRSPSFKSLQAGYLGMEQYSCHSCYTDSVAGEITSPCSTTDLRRWLR